MAREASGGLPDAPTTLRALGDIRMGSPEPPIARRTPENFRNDQSYFFYGQVNSQGELYDPDHVRFMFFDIGPSLTTLTLITRKTLM